MAGGDIDLDELVAAFASRPRSAGVVTDFDGTLSPIVEDPAAAAALPGAVDQLHRLARHYAVVAVVSGRPVSFLRDRLEMDSRGGGPSLHGLYGLERLDGRGTTVHPAALEWQGVVAEAADRARADAPEGVGVESKRYAVTLHVRRAPELAGWARSWAESAAAAAGLSLHPGRLSWELRPPVPVDKGTVVAGLVEGLSAACFVGDDLGDLPAFDALDRLVADGAGRPVALKVAVSSPEAPAELVERADLVVDGPAGALGFLRALLPD